MAQPHTCTWAPCEDCKLRQAIKKAMQKHTHTYYLIIHTSNEWASEQRLTSHSTQHTSWTKNKLHLYSLAHRSSNGQQIQRFQNISLKMTAITENYIYIYIYIYIYDYAHKIYWFIHMILKNIKNNKIIRFQTNTDNFRNASACDCIIPSDIFCWSLVLPLNYW